MNRVFDENYFIAEPMETELTMDLRLINTSSRGPMKEALANFWEYKTSAISKLFNPLFK